MNLDAYMTSDGPAATIGPSQRRLALARDLAAESNDDYMGDDKPKASGWATKLWESLESSKEAGEQAVAEVDTKLQNSLENAAEASEQFLQSASNAVSGSDQHNYEALTQRYEQALADKYMAPMEEISADAEYETWFDEKYDGQQPPATWDSMTTDLRNRGLL